MLAAVTLTLMLLGASQSTRTFLRAAAGPYTLSTDMPESDSKEALARLKIMHGSFAAQTAEWFPPPAHKTWFCLFTQEADYLDAGGTKTTGGISMPGKVIIFAGDHATQRTWQLMQHEGFHQFLHSGLNQPVPVWLDEGLAEYFGEAIFTGDGYTFGAVPTWRLQRVQNEIAEKKFLSFRNFLAISQESWKRQFNQAHYDQAWSMIHFLDRAEGGAHEKLVESLLHGAGNDELIGLEKQWREFWQKMTPEDCHKTYAAAAIDALTSFVTRAKKHGDIIRNFDELTQHVKESRWDFGPDWLPPELAEHALKTANELGTWQLHWKDNEVAIVGKLKNGTQLSTRWKPVSR